MRRIEMSTRIVLFLCLLLMLGGCGSKAPVQFSQEEYRVMVDQLLRADEIKCGVLEGKKTAIAVNYVEGGKYGWESFTFKDNKAERVTLDDPTPEELQGIIHGVLVRQCNILPVTKNDAPDVTVSISVKRFSAELKGFEKSRKLMLPSLVLTSDGHTAGRGTYQIDLDSTIELNGESHAFSPSIDLDVSARVDHTSNYYVIGFTGANITTREAMAVYRKGSRIAQGKIVMDEELDAVGFFSHKNTLSGVVTTYVPETNQVDEVYVLKEEDESLLGRKELLYGKPLLLYLLYMKPQGMQRVLLYDVAKQIVRLANKNAGVPLPDLEGTENAGRAGGNGANHESLTSMAGAAY